MKKTASKGRTSPGFRDLPFSQLIQRDDRLAEIRRFYAGQTAEDRRKAADWSYHESSATDIFNRTLARLGQESPVAERWPSGIEALAIDPTFAPALLTVGSMEYQLGRKSEAMMLFEALLKLPKDTTDLEEILEKAGTYLLQEDALTEAGSLFEAACSILPDSTRLIGGHAYSLARQGRHDEAVAAQRRAVALEPDNAELLSDLGWVLTEYREYEEAEQVLQNAVALAPPGYDRPRHNLEEVRRRKQSGTPR